MLFDIVYLSAVKLSRVNENTHEKVSAKTKIKIYYGRFPGGCDFC